MQKPATVLVTGASGFVGSHLTRALAANGYTVRAAARDTRAVATDSNITVVPMPDLMQRADWQPLLSGVSHIIHVAGIAHRSATREEHERGNHRAVAELADAAGAAGIAQFVFVSSIAAQTPAWADHVLRETDQPKPDSPYGHAKLAAEQAIRASGVPFTILRPVVIDGDGVKGNMALIRKIARLPLPLPFGALRNRRAILSVENFNRAVMTVLGNPAAYGETFIVANPKAMTVGEMISGIRRDLGRPPGLFKVPPGILEALAALAGQRALWNRLGGSLEVDPQKLVELGWQPMEEAIADQSTPTI